MGRGVTGGTTAVHGRLVWRILGRGVEALGIERGCTCLYEMKDITLLFTHAHKEN